MAPSNISPTAQKELDRVAALFAVSDDQLAQVTQAFGKAFRKGLQVPNQPVTMGPTWITDVPTGTEKGTFLSLELGWSSVVVSRVTLDGKRSFTTASKAFDISKDLMTADGVAFFGFLASCVGKFLQENAMQNNSGLILAFIFAFGTEQNSLADGKLLSWSKGFAIKGVVGQDVVKLLQTALDQAGVDVHCGAVLNDTVATMLAESYLCQPCTMSAIYGAGTNGAYLEKGAEITKLPSFQGTSMMINTEWGAFNERTLLKPTVYDDDADKGSANPGRNLFQKLTCWFYLGEVARRVLLSLVEQSLLFNGLATETLKKHHTLSTFHLFQIEDASDLETVKTLLCELFDYAAESVSAQDAEIAVRVATLVAVRSGKLAGCPIACLLTHLGYSSGSASSIPMAVDGEFFIGSAKFESRLKQSVASILGNGVGEKLVLHKVEGKGHVGAAIAALQVANAQ